MWDGCRPMSPGAEFKWQVLILGDPSPIFGGSKTQILQWRQEWAFSHLKQYQRCKNGDRGDSC